jgi:hypothetical protein
MVGSGIPADGDSEGAGRALLSYGTEYTMSEVITVSTEMGTKKGEVVGNLPFLCLLEGRTSLGHRCCKQIKR